MRSLPLPWIEPFYIRLYLVKYGHSVRTIPADAVDHADILALLFASYSAVSATFIHSSVLNPEPLI